MHSLFNKGFLLSDGGDLSCAYFLFTAKNNPDYLDAANLRHRLPLLTILQPNIKGVFRE